MTTYNIAYNPVNRPMTEPIGFESEAFATEYRIQLATYLIENAKIIENTEESLENADAIFKKQPDAILKNNDKYYFLTPEKKITQLAVGTINSDIPWIIETKGHQEYIEELPNYREQDEYGYYELVY